MDNQEAIKTLRELRRETYDPWYEEVYDKAISALKCVEMLNKLERRGLKEVRAQLDELEQYGAIRVELPERIGKEILTDWSLRND